MTIHTKLQLSLLAVVVSLLTGTVVLPLVPATSAATPSSCNPIVIDNLGIEHPFSWLQAIYPGIQCVPVPDANVQHFELQQIIYKSDPSATGSIIVRDAAGLPKVGQPTTYWFPDRNAPYADLPMLPAAYLTHCSSRGVLNNNVTDAAGRVEYGWGANSYMNQGRGPYGYQVLSVSATSECLDGIGWDPYSEHKGYVIAVFKQMASSVPTPTPTVTIPIPTVTPTPTPGTGDLAETNALLRENNNLLRQLISVLTAIGQHLGVNFSGGLVF